MTILGAAPSETARKTRPPSRKPRAVQPASDNCRRAGYQLKTKNAAMTDARVKAIAPSIKGSAAARDKKKIPMQTAMVCSPATVSIPFKKRYKKLNKSQSKVISGMLKNGGIWENAEISCGMKRLKTAAQLKMVRLMYLVSKREET